MKQVYLLDKHDLHALRAGEPFEIHVAGQVIVLRSETVTRRNGTAPPEAPKPKKKHSGGATRVIDPKLRARAEKMLKAGERPVDVGRALGLNPKSVDNWRRKLKGLK